MTKAEQDEEKQGLWGLLIEQDNRRTAKKNNPLFWMKGKLQFSKLLNLKLQNG